MAPYVIRPLDGGYYSDYSSLHAPPGTMVWPAKNIKIETHMAKKRWGYDTAYREIGTTSHVLDIINYTQKDGTAMTLVLTETDLIKVETTASATFSYKTQSDTVGTVKSISGTNVGCTGADWVNNGIAAGDMFILDTDYTEKQEPAGGDTNWTSISSVTDSENLVLATAYSGTTGASLTESYRIRKLYSVPTGERWSHAVVGDKFCFSNGNTNVQVFTDTGYATDLDSTNAIKARYLCEYANRLILADYGSTRDPLALAWSKEGDPTDWTDATAGSIQFLETRDYITNVGQVGQNLMVYRQKGYIIGNRSGISTDPIWFPRKRLGKGLFAPYSLIEAHGTHAFLGDDDFYMVFGSELESIGEGIRDFFFEQVTKANAALTYGFANEYEKELIWLATTTDNGQLAFVYNWQSERWYVYDYADVIESGGLASDSVYYLGDTGGLMRIYSDTLYGDGDTKITCQWVSRRLDYLDQRKELLGKYKSTDMIRLIYEDHGEQSVGVDVSADGGTSWGGDTKTVGTTLADTYLKGKSYGVIKTGEFHNIKITHADSTTKFAFVQLDVDVLEAGDIL